MHAKLHLWGLISGPNKKSLSKLKKISTRGTWECPKNVVHMCIEPAKIDNNASSARLSLSFCFVTKSDGPDWAYLFLSS